MSVDSLSIWVNFTNNPLVQSSNLLAHRAWHKKCHSVSPTKLHPTLPVHSTRSYAKHLCFTLNAMGQKDQRKSTGTKADCKMMLKLSPNLNSIWRNNLENVKLEPLKFFTKVVFWISTNSGIWKFDPFDISSYGSSSSKKQNDGGARRNCFIRGFVDPKLLNYNQNLFTAGFHFVILCKESFWFKTNIFFYTFLVSVVFFYLQDTLRTFHVCFFKFFSEFSESQMQLKKLSK